MTHNESPLYKTFKVALSKVGNEMQIWQMYKKLTVNEIELIIKNIQSWRETERIRGAQEEKQYKNLA